MAASQNANSPGVNAPANPGRRAAIAGILGFAAGVAVDLGTNLAASALYDTYKRRRAPGLELRGLSLIAPDKAYRPRGREYADLAYELFLSSLAVDTRFVLPDNWKDREGNVIPPNVTLADGTHSYGHEANVFRDISSFLVGELQTSFEEAAQMPVTGAPHSQIILGSSASNEGTANIMGYPHRPIFDNATCTLRYAISLSGHAVKRWQYGKFVTEDAKSIVDRHGKVLHAESHGGDLTDDYLLVTRLPGMREGTTVTIFSGLHGPGTRSAALLFSSIQLAELRRLADCIELSERPAPHFQAVFRASNFKRNLVNDDTDSDVASKIELVTDRFPPVRLTDC